MSKRKMRLLIITSLVAGLLAVERELSQTGGIGFGALALVAAFFLAS